MPRAVDHEQRRRDIVNAVCRVAADEGPGAVTFRRIAKELGGSTTLVTEAFSTRAELLSYAVTTRLTLWQEAYAGFAANEGDPLKILRTLLVENCPVDEEGFRESRFWLMSLPLSEVATGFRVRDHSVDYAGWFAEQIGLLLDRLAVDRTATDRLLITVYGITVAAVEDPDAWPRTRVEALIDTTLASVGLTVADPA